MTTKDMRAARAAGKSRTDVAWLRKNKRAGIEPAADRDSPDATALMRKATAKRRVGRPTGSDKEQVAIRFDKDILSSFRADGPGWQTRINAALRDWIRTH